MAKENKPQRRGAAQSPPPIIKPTPPEVPSTRQPAPKRVADSGPKVREVHQALLFTKMNYIQLGVGIGLIALGFILMSGGRMADPNTWDESQIYSFRRITLAPMVVLIGIGVVVYSIFFHKPDTKAEA